MNKYARKCNECGKVFNKGYVVNGGEEYYCSKSCLKLHYTEKEWDLMYDKGKGDSYYTEWEDEEDFQFYENGLEVEE